MSRVNIRFGSLGGQSVATPTPRTHNGAPAAVLSPYAELRRQTLAALLWEDQFYSKGSTQAAAIAKLVQKVSPGEVATLAQECRNEMYLRHMPLLLARELARHPEVTKHKMGGLVAETLCNVIQRADELGEFLAIYWRDKKQPISSGVKRGLAKAFGKFNAYQLAKYNRDSAQVKLRDVMRLVRPKPMNADQAALWKMVKEDTLPTPDTWEVALSAASSTAAKREVWERLLSEKKLGAMAFLRNLRNMTQVGVDPTQIGQRFQGNFDKVLPFRFLAAAKHAPNFVAPIEEAMLRSAMGLPKLQGHTILLIDVSGSMDYNLSDKSDLRRLEAANALAMLLREVCESVEFHTFSTTTVKVRGDLRGFKLNDAIVKSQQHGGTNLGHAVKMMNPLSADRLIVLSDEQTSDPVGTPNFPLAYMINVAADKHGVGYGNWIHIDGFSERVVDYIAAYEKSLNLA